MKLFCLILFFQFSFIQLAAQKTKPTYFYDIDGNQVSKEYFTKKYKVKLKDNNHLLLSFENDSSYIKTYIRRKDYGRLDDKNLESLYKNIETDGILPEEKFSIIQYHPGRDRCNNGRITYNGHKNHAYGLKYLKKLNKSFDFKSYWVNKQDSTIDFSNSKKIKWQLDKKQTVEKLFFIHHFSCGSFVIINNETGLYLSSFGEYGASSIIKALEEISKKSQQ